MGRPKCWSKVYSANSSASFGALDHRLRYMLEWTGSPYLSVPVRQLKFHCPQQSSCLSLQTISGISAPFFRADSKALSCAMPLGPAPIIRTCFDIIFFSLILSDFVLVVF